MYEFGKSLAYRTSCRRCHGVGSVIHECPSCRGSGLRDTVPSVFALCPDSLQGLLKHIAVTIDLLKREEANAVLDGDRERLVICAARRSAFAEVGMALQNYTMRLPKYAATESGS